ncbi:patched homolog 1-like, partial [Paramuricea clavata]
NIYRRKYDCIEQCQCQVSLFNIYITSLENTTAIVVNREKSGDVGGRLENELAYTKTYGYDYKSYEVIIQTPKTEGTNVLTAEALLRHAEAVKKAMKVEVEVLEQTWSVQDICSKPAVPKFNMLMDKMLEQIIPCTVITPLDCFWDGAKIYTQNITTAISNKTIHWTTFDPLNFINDLPDFAKKNLDTSKMDSMLAEAGISHGYLNRPCLDPKDPRCPNSAPNKASKKIPDIGKELTGGCKGFAEKMMIWPEDLIVGGTRRNRSGFIRSAEAIQTVINLMSEEEVYYWWKESNGFTKVQHLGIGWNVEAAKKVLNAWQRKFVQVVNELSEPVHTKQNIMAFSTTSFNDLLRNFSSPNQALIIGGYVLMIVYACFTMIRWNSVVQSQGCMGIVGVLLVSLSVASGLGLCSFAGISFNAATTQVLPFISLGLGVDDMFLLSHTYRDLYSKNLRSKEYAGYCLSTTGVSIMLTSITNLAAFFLAAIIPIPALRALCIMAGVIIIFNFFSIVLIYPAIIGIDVKRREDQRYDIFCCVRRDSSTNVRHLRPGTISSMTTYNQTSSDDDSTLHQISSCANVSFGQCDAFTLPGVALKASANCNINDSICNSMLGGDIRSWPGMGNIVVSVSSSGQNIDGDSSQNANANVNASYGRGRTLDISASSSASSGTRTNSRRIRDFSSMINRGCTSGPSNQDNKQTKNAQSSAKIALNPNRVSPSCQSRDPQMGGMHVSANATVDSTQGEPSCSSNAEVILRPEKVRNSRQRSMAWQRTMNSKLVKNITRLSLGHLTKTYYAPLLQKTAAKVVILFLFAIIFSISIYGCIQVKDGVDVTDVVPKGTKLAEFLEARNEYFSFYDIFIITKDDFDYANKQDELYRLHQAFSKVDYIVKDKDGNLPKFWLHYFKDWLEGLQKAFDNDMKKGAITLNKRVGPKASTAGKLAYKLLMGTGRPNETAQLRTQKLVNKDGIINRRGFNGFLRAWYRKDPLGYESSMVKINPTPDEWTYLDEKEYVRPTGQNIKYAQIPFYINGLKETADYINVIKQVREICDKFTDEGLTNYPRGVPFTFWEQYIWLRKQLLITVIVVLVASFLIISAILVNIWAGTIMVVILAMATVELFGFLGLSGIKLSAIPAVTLIFSVAVGVEFTVHLCMVFVASVGTRNDRIRQALESVLSPVVDGAVSTILGVIMLAGSEFDFVVKYFFHVLAAMIVIGFLNGIVLLPVILSLIGPNPEVVPLQDLNSTPCTRSWFGLTTFDRNTCSSVSNLTNDAQQYHSRAQQDDTIETEDVQLETMEQFDSETRKFKRDTCNEQFDSRIPKPKTGVTPKQMYGKTLPSLIQNTKPDVRDRPQNTSNIRNSHGIAEVTATATVTVKVPIELKQGRLQESTSNTAIVPRYNTQNSDMEVVDLEDEFV